jgi:hypothetical protein
MVEPNLFIYNNFNFNDLIDFKNEDLSFLKEYPEMLKPLMKDASTQTDFKDNSRNSSSKIKYLKSTFEKKKAAKLNYLILNKKDFNKLNKIRKRRISNNLSAAISRRKSKLKMRDITENAEYKIKCEIDALVAKRKEFFGDNININVNLQ